MNTKHVAMGMELKYFLFVYAVLCGCSTVSGISEEKSVVKEELFGCSIKQTMAWRECGTKFVCPSTCNSKDDCTFPYCDSSGRCRCRQAWCKESSSCDFFRISCSGNFTCVNSGCRCQL